MTRLIDVHTPRCDVSETLVVHVDAPPAAVLAAVDRDVAREPFAGLRPLGRTGRERLFGLSWRPVPAAAPVEVVWDLRVECDGEGGCYLASTRRFVAGDDAARDGLHHQWRHIRGAADLIARRALRTVKRAAEAAPAAGPRAELALAA